ncbi:archaemetzincin [Candidatus Kryptobacter tengchongensis]|uniref:archaemetzincin family Zn-dependent metalloprotease n=1 Tax=Kryptobacter tengchongensis TaxID=1643429 RepID=UPI00070756B0|nr:archaemetzincin family Zn-dependent metalloprotease [Candidatus Kryptobacter tengchongensis]CUS83208.1 archaemetzincin [Candidatus Kryptobacter tengchongensis]CUU06351.1 archaemetzincin [Candidatus Kryptobacter tengchongensis]
MSSSKSNKILIAPIYPVDFALALTLVSPLKEIFKCDVLLDNTNHINLSFAYDSSRSQFNSTKIILALSEKYKNFNGKVLGIISVDLFIPVLTYVFGEAQLGGKVSIVSTLRLNEIAYGLPENRKLTEERLLKEAVHELGHNFGLLHCENYLCVMHPSTSIEEVDIKTSSFCKDCYEKLFGQTFTELNDHHNCK